MDYEETFEKLKFFVKTGIAVLSTLVLVAIGMKYIPSAIYITSSASSTKLPIYSVSDQDKKISLTFDLAGGNENTEQILETLSIYDIKATFFMTGEWISRFPSQVKAIAASGHDIGNNSENHLHMTHLSKQEKIEEILQTHNKVKELTGIEMNLFRAPYGEYNNALIDIADELGYLSIHWNIDSLDWKDYGVNSIIKTVFDAPELSGGSIILLHGNAKYTPEALEVLITGLQEEGYSFVPVSQLVYADNYYINEYGQQVLRK